MCQDSCAEDLPVESPSAYPLPGVYDVAQLVTLACRTPGATIHFTTDGSLPTPSSAVFDPNRLVATASQEDLQEKSTHTIRAVAVAHGRFSQTVTFKYTVERRGPDEYVSREVSPGTRAICDFDNDRMYLLVGTRRALLVDTGAGRGDLRGYIETFTAGMPLDIVLTHGHSDHIAMLGQFQRDCKVYMNLADLPLMASSVEGLGFDIDLSQIDDLREGHVFALGNRAIRAYALPGHTPGSMVLLDEVDGGLFSGDAVGNNRPTIVDTLWMHLSESTPIDVFLSSLRVFRARTSGRVRAIYTGHNDRPLNGDAYLNHLERAAQALVDRGVAVLTPSLHPTGIHQVVSGNRFTDPDWAGINVDRDRCLSADPDRIATLSNLQVDAAPLNEPFSPSLHFYTARVGPSASQAKITATPTSSRIHSISINGRSVQSGHPYSTQVREGETPFLVDVRSPDGSILHTYVLVITRSAMQSAFDAD